MTRHAMNTARHEHGIRQPGLEVFSGHLKACLGDDSQRLAPGQALDAVRCRHGVHVFTGLDGSRADMRGDDDPGHRQEGIVRR